MRMSMNRIRQHNQNAQTPSERRGFTVIELLVVVAIIILLLSILAVAVNRVVLGAQSANTTALMSSITQGLAKFEGDHGYLPPVLNDDRGVRFSFATGDRDNGPDPTDSSYRDDVQDWYSITTLAEYLIGWDHGCRDGYGETSANNQFDGEIPLTGIRSPGADGVWGATYYGSQDGSIEAREAHLCTDVIQGKRFGPYLELKDKQLLGGIDPNGNIVFADEDSSFNSYAKVIVDYWGTPLRYYRPAYPAGQLKHNYNRIESTNADGHTVPLPSLSDVFVLRPSNVNVSGAINGLNDASSNGGDPTSVRSLLAAKFAIFSAGADVTLNQLIRVDEEEFNRDNIVEVGP